MGTFSLPCDHCNEELEIDHDLIGELIECPSCSSEFIVPEKKLDSPPSALSPSHDVAGVQTIADGAQPCDLANASSKGDATYESESADNPESNSVLDTGRRQAATVFNDLKSIKFREEVLPIDSNNIGLLLRDYVFWAAALLGVIPLLIITVNHIGTQLTLFALFFACVWGVIFKLFVLKDSMSWKWPIAVLFFTGTAGIWLLLFIHRVALPDSFLEMSSSKNPLTSLVGYVCAVGFWEEVIKAIPLLLFALIKRGTLKPIELVTLGVFSGLGFAAFENLHYGERAVFSSFALTKQYGADGLVSGVQNAMIVTMLRAVSLVFCHAVWSGIVGYFIATALLRKRRVAALIILGFSVAASLHGAYNWLAGMQATMAALLAGFSFMLFYGYHAKLVSMVELDSNL